MKFKAIFILLLALFQMKVLSSESLFDSALEGDNNVFEASLDLNEEEENSVLTNYRLNGLLKSGIYLNKDFDESNDNYFISSLKFETDINNYGKAYAELTFEDRKSEDDAYIQEAYFDIYKEKLDLRVGKQIVVWGRSDAVNPTDNINTKDRTVYSPDSDDSRIANFMIKVNYDLYPFNIEAVVAPDYAEAVLPVDINFTEYENESSIALKLSYEYAQIDGSFSYFHGYSTTPGVTLSGSSLYLKPYEQDVFGWDFAKNFGKYGFRNEFAYKHTEEYEDNDYIPNPELSYIAGIDRELFRNFTLNLQYYIKYTNDFSENMTSIEERTAIINQQTEEIQNSIICRITYSLFYETLVLENLTSYNLDTEELYTKLESEYDISDSFVFIFGLDYYDGDEGTLTELIEDSKTSLYSEIKVEF